MNESPKIADLLAVATIRRLLLELGHELQPERLNRTGYRGGLLA
jgi:hypothetical protein